MKAKSKAKAKARPKKKMTPTEKELAEKFGALRGKATKQLFVELTDAEMVDAAKRLARSINRTDSIQEEVKIHRSEANAELKEIREDQKRLTSILGGGKEERVVEVLIFLDFKTDKKRWVRADTGEVVATAAIPSEDRQEALALEREKKGKGKKASGEKAGANGRAARNAAPAA